MWNHAQNSTTSGEENTSEGDPASNLKDRIERSLDLTQYLKYLDQLFSQVTSESESSDSDDGERNRKFNDFLQPPAQAFDRSQPQFCQNHAGANPTDSNHVAAFGNLKSGESFQLDANISSSSLSSIDSGTSSLSITLSSDNGIETIGKTEESSSFKGKSKSPSHTENNDKNSVKAEEDREDENTSEKEKKSQKKKKGGRGSSESLPRQHKPSSGGKGNGSRGGGGAGGLATGGGSGDSSGSSGGSSSANQGFGSSSGSPGAKSRSGKQDLQKSDSLKISPCLNSIKNDNDYSRISLSRSNSEDFQKCFIETNNLNSLIGTSDALLMNEDLTDNFVNEMLSASSESADTYETGELSSFPLNTLLDFEKDEDSLSDYISMAATTAPSTSHSPPLPQSSTNFFSKIAATAASSAFSFSRSNSIPKGNVQNRTKTCKSESKKRKLEGKGKFSNSPPTKLLKLTEKQKQSRIEMLNAKRRKIYVYICRKEIGKTQRNRVNTLKESFAMKRKLAHACARHLRKQALQSQKCMKESVCKAKRLTQEMEAHWKLIDRATRDLQRKKEKDAEEKLKKDMELAKCTVEKRKINRLVTHIELFTAKLLNVVDHNSESEILHKLSDPNDDGVTNLKSYDSEKDKSLVQGTIDRALKEHQNLVKLLDMSGTYLPDEKQPFSESTCKGITQPQMFEGVLKNYQIKGMNWIKKLYTLGLNGILADETGLGRKVQIIAFLSHLAESCNLWGPFLVVSPPSSLFKWQQEFYKMSPRFKVFPYWGKPTERKILRQFWERNCLHKEEAHFHVVLTSYQAMVSDLKYFSKIKWQYLITDDSQGAITSSTKWMPLLSFRCRNKLLISGVPKLNSQSHLCSYLYFIMPSLFDSQEEFSEWLLKELETPSAEFSDDVDQNTSRLQAVIQRFLLRRLKKDVEIEATHNIDMQLYCSLSRRQRRIYNGLLGKTDLQGLLQDLEGFTQEEIRRRKTELLHLSVQLRKSCNHPDLIEKRDCVSSMWMNTINLVIPKLAYQIELPTDLTRTNGQLFQKTFTIFESYNVHNSLYGGTSNNFTKRATWSFVRLLNISCSELETLRLNGHYARLIYLVNFQSVLEKIYYDAIWNENQHNYLVSYYDTMLWYSLTRSKVLSNLVFTSHLSSSLYTWGTEKILSMPETIEHRALRSRKSYPGLENPPMTPEIKHVERKPIFRTLQPLQYPKLLKCTFSKVIAGGCKALVTSKRLNRHVEFVENRCLVNELRSSLQGKVPEPCAISLLWQALVKLDTSQTLVPNNEHLIYDSGKLKQLDGLLTVLKHTGHRVLIYAYISGTLDILEEFLASRRWKYVHVENKLVNNLASDFFIYLVSAHTCFSRLPKIPVDTVVFYDQDWDVKIEDQKAKIINNIVDPSHVNFYRLVCRGTVEERMLKLMKERNIVSLALCQDVDNVNGSAIPSLKSLVSVLLGDCHKDKQAVRYEGPKAVPSDGYNHKKNSQSFTLEEEKSNMYLKDGHAGAVYSGIVEILDYVNGTEGSDSASPSCSEELDAGEIEGDDIKDCQDEDNFGFSFDEGYMGMSPDSFEDAAIKSDYEEDSSPKKPKIGRGTGKRGRPPSRIRFQRRDINDASQNRRGPGRPRLKPVGPANQGIRGRKPGRPPLSKKAETISSGLPPLSSGQRVFGFYSSPDLELS